MKNLKKVLALGLALVMILGMFTIASAAETKKVATDLTDWASVENKDAVSLMVDLGVISGMPDGTYAPANNIDRASWAKMVFFVLTGETDAGVYESDYPALKDIANNWAQGYIEYLYSIECISGDTDGNYNPGNPISVVAAAKTMLTGLGYNSKIEGYENDANWATNIMNRAKSVGLMKGISLKQNDNITRDAAAQMVYNALSAKTQTAKYQLNFMTGERVPSGEYTEGETLGEKAFDVVKITAKVNGVEKGVASFTNLKDADDKAITASPKNDVKAALSDMGKTVTLWVKSDYSEYVSTSVASAAVTPFKTVTGGVDWTKVYDKDDKDNFIADDAATVTYFVNGDTGVTTAPTPAPVAGDVVEFYTNSDGEIDIVHVYQYQVGEVTADVTSKTKDDVTTVNLNLANVTANLPSDQISGDWASLKEGDIVLYYTKGTNKDMVVSLEKAEKITGKVSHLNAKSKKVTINGTQYAQSELTTVPSTGDNAPGFASWVVADAKDNEYDFYLDKNGTVCWKVLVKGEVETKVAYVLDAAKVEPTASGLSQAGDKYIEAKILFADATTEIVKIVKVGDDKTKDMNSNALDTAVTTVKDMIDYSVNSDGNYEVKAKNATGTAGAIAAKPAFATGLTANDSTVFIVEKTNGDDDSEFFAYTGYKTVPAMNAEDVTALKVVENDDHFVTYAYIQTSAFAGEGSDGLIYINDATDYGSGATADVYTFYNVVDAKGELVDLDVKTDNVAGITTGFYTIKSTTDGVAVLEKDTTATVAVTSVGGGVIKVEDGKSYSYDSASVCVLIDKTDDLAAAPFNPGNFKMDEDNTYTAVVKANSDDVIEYIYIVVTANAG